MISSVRKSRVLVKNAIALSLRPSIQSHPFTAAAVQSISLPLSMHSTPFSSPSLFSSFSSSSAAASLSSEQPYSPSPSLSPEEKLKHSYEYCKQRVMSVDRESYQIGLIFPSKHRDAYFVLRALNVELGAIKEVTSEPTLGHIRMTWWSNAIKDCFKGQPPDQPVCRALADVASKYKLSRRYIDRMIEHRSKDLDERQPRSLEWLEAYGEGVYSSLLYLTLELLGVQNVNADHAASHIGKALGISILLRATPYHAQKRRTYLPMNMMAKHNLSEEDIYRAALMARDHPEELTKAMAEAALQSSKDQAEKEKLKKSSSQEQLHYEPASMHVHSEDGSCCGHDHSHNHHHSQPAAASSSSPPSCGTPGHVHGPECGSHPHSTPSQSSSVPPSPSRGGKIVVGSSVGGAASAVRAASKLAQQQQQQHSSSPSPTSVIVNFRAIEEVSFEVANFAKMHLDQARDLKASVPKEAIPALWPVFISDSYLDRLQKMGFNVFHPSLNSQPLPFLWKLTKAGFMKYY